MTEPSWEEKKSTLILSDIVRIQQHSKSLQLLECLVSGLW